MKKLDRDPFSNGTEFEFWYDRNCDRCIKCSHPVLDKYGNYIRDTKIVCAIQREYFMRMYSNEPISQRTLDICSMADCPFRKEERKRYEKNKRFPKLFDE